MRIAYIHTHTHIYICVMSIYYIYHIYTRCFNYTYILLNFFAFPLETLYAGAGGQYDALVRGQSLYYTSLLCILQKNVFI